MVKLLLINDSSWYAAQTGKWGESSKYFLYNHKGFDPAISPIVSPFGTTEWSEPTSYLLGNLLPIYLLTNSDFASNYLSRKSPDINCFIIYLIFNFIHKRS